MRSLGANRFFGSPPRNAPAPTTLGSVPAKPTASAGITSAGMALREGRDGVPAWQRMASLPPSPNGPIGAAARRRSGITGPRILGGAVSATPATIWARRQPCGRDAAPPSTVRRRAARDGLDGAKAPPGLDHRTPLRHKPEAPARRSSPCLRFGLVGLGCSVEMPLVKASGAASARRSPPPNLDARPLSAHPVERRRPCASPGKTAP
jgi:hypothetical protein